MSGTELVYNLFSECRKGTGSQHSGLCAADPSTFGGIWPVVHAISVAMIVKAGLTIVTFGIKVPAGIFIPSLGVGACAGRVMGIAMQWLQYRYPGSKMFAICKGDMDCKILLFSMWNYAEVILPSRYHPRLICDGRCGSHPFWGHSRSSSSSSSSGLNLRFLSEPPCL
jgi:hypothetical protein